MSTAGRCIARKTSSGTVVGPGIARNSRPARTDIGSFPSMAARHAGTLRREVKPKRSETIDMQSSHVDRRGAAGREVGDQPAGRRAHGQAEMAVAEGEERVLAARRLTDDR